MADSDKIVGKVIAQPQVWVTDGDANGHYYGFDEVGSVGGSCTYVATLNDRFFYDGSVDVTTNANLITGDFTNGVAVAADDLIQHVCIRHTGVDDNGDVTDQDIHVTLDGGAPKAANDAIEINPNGSFIMTPYNLRVDKLLVCSDDDSNVIVEVVAIILDSSQIGG